MINILLDTLPEEYNGYALDTDFRIGIMATQALSDVDLTDAEKISVALQLIFKDEIPPLEEANEAIEWYINGWNHDNHVKTASKEAVMDFNMDAGRIFSAFMAQYRINLNIENMHFWQFMILLSNLGECSYTQVIEIRQKDLKGMDRKQRKIYEQSKRMYAIKTEMSEEDKQLKAEMDERFLQQMGMK